MYYVESVCIRICLVNQQSIELIERLACTKILNQAIDSIQWPIDEEGELINLQLQFDTIGTLHVHVHYTTLHYT